MKREFLEETGLKSVQFSFLGSHQISMPHGTVHMTSYTARIPKTVDLTINLEEHHAYAWFSLEGLLDEDNILWGIPSILRDFKLLGEFDIDPTLRDGSSVKLIKLK